MHRLISLASFATASADGNGLAAFSVPLGGWLALPCSPPAPTAAAAAASAAACFLSLLALVTAAADGPTQSSVRRVPLPSASARRMTNWPAVNPASRALAVFSA